MTAYYSAPAFLEAWLRGIEIAGWQWFGDGQKPDTPPTDKYGLAPRYDDICDSIGMLSSGESALLVAMYGFYNSYVATKLWEAVSLRPMADLASRLDEPRRRVIADLLVSYEGW